MLIVASLVMAGCASFPGNNLPKQGYGNLVSAQPKAVIDYDVTFIGQSGEQMYTASHLFAEQVKSVFEKSNVFASHNLNGKGAPVHLSVTMKNKGNLTAAKLAGIVAGLTLTIVPVCGTDEYELTVDIGSGDKVFKRYAYNDHVTTWFQLFLIFASPSHKPGEVTHEVVENMLLHFLHDAQADGVLSITNTDVSDKRL